MGAKAKPFQFFQVLGAGGIGLGGLGLLVALALDFIQPERGVLVLVLCSIALSLWGFLCGVMGTVGDYLVGMNHEIGHQPKYLIRQYHD